jgi:hypothetical protein
MRKFSRKGAKKAKMPSIIPGAFAFFAPLRETYQKREPLIVMKGS